MTALTAARLCSYALAGCLLLLAFAKVVFPASAPSPAGSVEWPSVAVAAVAAMEAALGIWLLARPASRRVLMVSVAFALCLATVAIVAEPLLFGDRHVSCGCFGRIRVSRAERVLGAGILMMLASAALYFAERVSGRAVASAKIDLNSEVKPVG